jgi:hypothetical protein
MSFGMREFVTAEIACRDSGQNEIVVQEISVARNYGSSSHPDYRVQKDRYETADKLPVVSLDASRFQIVESGLILRIIASGNLRAAA